jgi:hypothetical protein
VTLPARASGGKHGPGESVGQRPAGYEHARRQQSASAEPVQRRRPATHATGHSGAGQSSGQLQ